MIQIKISTKQKERYFSLPNLEEILKQLLGYLLEKTDYYDPNFNGFYLMPNKRTIYVPHYVVQKNNLKPIIEFNNGYSMIGFTEYDGQDNTLENSIKKYLTLCDQS